MNAQEIIHRLGLEPHPEEGGFFRETYRAAECTPAVALPSRYGKGRGETAKDGTARNHGTAIYYLLTPDTYSHLHRLKSDEIFHFYLGGPVRMLQLAPEGGSRTLTIGPDIMAGHEPQVVVPRGVWQGACLLQGEFALLGCTVAPGFEFADYDHASRAELLAQYPEYAADIKRLTAT